MRHRPTLYIGIGGTGCRTLVEIQKYFQDEFGDGNIPEYIRFIGIDTDSFPEAEYVQKFFCVAYGTMSPKDYYKSKKENNTGECDWYPNNPDLLPGLGCGTASNRSNARFLLEMDSYRLMSYIRSTLSELSNIAMYEFNTREVDVRFVISLAGGTGSGMLIPLAVMISQYENTILYGYSLLQGFLRKYDLADRRITNSFMNCYAATLELDYIQHATEDSPFKIKICNIDFTVKDQLFKEFYMVESTDGTGRVVNHYKDLLKMLSLSMYSASFEYDPKTSIKDGIRTGLFNFENKIGWLCSLGGCEITYKGAEAAILQSYVDSRKIISQLVENGDEDIKVINTMMFSGIYGTDEPEYWGHLKDKLQLPRNIEGVDFRLTSSRLENIKEQIKIAREPIDLSDRSSEIKLYVGNNYNLPNLEKLFTALETELPSILAKLRKQKSSIQKSLETVLELIDDTYLAMTRWRGLFLAFMPEKKEANIIALENQVKKAIMLQQEIALREYVVGKIEQISVEVRTQKTKCQVLYAQLQTLDLQIENDMDNQLLKLRKEGSFIKHDISYAYWKTRQAQAQAQEISLPDRFISILLECDDICEIKDRLLQVTYDSPEVQYFRDVIIEDAIDSLPEIYKSGIIRFLSTSVNRMLALDRRGLMIGASTIHNGILTVYSNKQIPSLAKDMEQISGFTTNMRLNHSSASGLKDRIILSYYEGGVLPYCIKAFTPEMIAKEYKEALESGRYNPHIDTKLFETIKALDYSLAPKFSTKYSIVPSVSSLDPKPEEIHPDQVILKEKTRYKVFISAKSADYAYAEQVYDFLVERNLSVFLACRELKRIGEAEYALAIDAALDDTEHMIVILSSPEYAKSKWVQYEWSTFENDKKSGYREGNLLVIKHPEVEQKKLPPALRHKETFLFDSYKESLCHYLR